MLSAEALAIFANVADDRQVREMKVGINRDGKGRRGRENSELNIFLTVFGFGERKKVGIVCK